MENGKRNILLAIVVIALLGIGAYLIFRNSNKNEGGEAYKDLVNSLCKTTLSLADTNPETIVVDKTKPGSHTYVTFLTLAGLTIDSTDKVSHYIEDPRKSTTNNPVYFPETTRVKLSVDKNGKVVCDGLVDVGSAPVITLVGGDKITVTLGSNFVDPGAKAVDVEDGDLSNKIMKNGLVNTSVAGEYTLLYFVQDSMGNITSKVRSVTVK